MPDLVEMYQRGETMLDDYITHTMPFDGGWVGWAGGKRAPFDCCSPHIAAGLGQREGADGAGGCSAA